MADSKLQIWNMALGHLKADNAVQTENENSLEGENCRLYYDTARLRVLRDFDWTFARKRVVLALTGTAPEGWAFSYGYPSDAVMARFLYNPLDPLNEDAPPLKFEVAPNPDAAGKVIWTDIEDAILLHTQDVTDTTLFDPKFDISLSFYLASFLSRPITGDRTKWGDMMSAYQLELPSAQRSDAEEQGKDQTKDADWIIARA